MGFDLFSRSGAFFSCHIEDFPAMLRLARSHGWRPCGTEPPGYWEGEWEGDYCTNDRQHVTDAAALGIAKALESALNEDAMAELKTEIVLLSERLKGLDFEHDPTPNDALSGAFGKTRLREFTVREFIAFCRSGGFTIT